MGFSRRVVLWIKSYLKGRNQKVVTKLNGNSDWLTTNLGVPQGSVLFSLYINDFQCVLSHLNNSTTNPSMNSVKHYADDLQIYTQTTRESLLGGMERLSAAAGAVSSWASDGALSLNVGKTKAIIIGSDYNINLVKNMNLLGIEIRDGVYVPFDDTVTNLGVVMDSKLTWEPQLDAVSRKVNRALYGLKLFRSCTTEVLRKQLVGALVLSHLDYCCLIYLDVTTDLQIRLQRLQNSCVRYVCGVSKCEHISPYRRKLQWLDLRE